MCVVWLNWWYSAAVFQFLIIVICIASCLQNIMTLLTKHWLVSTTINFSVRQDPEGELIAISVIELSFLWVKIVTPCGFVQWPKMWFLLLNWWRITTCKRVHWNIIDFCFVSNYSIFKLVNKVLVQHFITWSTDFGFRFYLVLFAALFRSPNHKYKDANRFQNIMMQQFHCDLPVEVPRRK